MSRTIQQWTLSIEKEFNLLHSPVALFQGSYKVWTTFLSFLGGFFQKGRAPLLVQAMDAAPNGDTHLRWTWNKKKCIIIDTEYKNTVIKIVTRCTDCRGFFLLNNSSIVFYMAQCCKRSKPDFKLKTILEEWVRDSLIWTCTIRQWFERALSRGLILLAG